MDWGVLITGISLGILMVLTVRAVGLALINSPRR